MSGGVAHEKQREQEPEHAAPWAMKNGAGRGPNDVARNPAPTAAAETAPSGRRQQRQDRPLHAHHCPRTCSPALADRTAPRSPAAPARTPESVTRPRWRGSAPPDDLQPPSPADRSPADAPARRDDAAA